MQIPGRPMACLVPRSRIERERLPSRWTTTGPKGLGVHAAGNYMITNSVPLGFVAESVLEMASLGSAFKVIPKPQQSSPSQHKVKGLWTHSQYHGKHERLMLLIRRFKAFLFPFLVKWGGPAVLVQPGLKRFEALGILPFPYRLFHHFIAVGRENLIKQPSSSLSVKIQEHEAILQAFISVGLHTVHPWSTAHRLVGATRRKCGTWRGCLSIFRKIVLWT